MKYKQGRYNLAATIFVPWDCDNNCPFCTSKTTYKNKQNFNLKNVIDSINILNKKAEIKEFVITGGEPFANINGIKEIVSCCQKPVYINTTLPTKTYGEAREIINNTEVIKGVNVSRHITYEFKNVATVGEIDLIKKPIRINTVFSERDICDIGILKLKDFIYKYGKKKRDINIREDYRLVTLSSLKSRNALFEWLAETFDYIETESCMVCNSDYFSVENSFICAYHRGLELSSVTYNDKCYINDVIVAQDGKIYKDWNRKEDDEFTEWLYSTEKGGVE